MAVMSVVGVPLPATFTEEDALGIGKGVEGFAATPLATDERKDDMREETFKTAAGVEDEPVLPFAEDVTCGAAAEDAEEAPTTAAGAEDEPFLPFAEDVTCGAAAEDAEETPTTAATELAVAVEVAIPAFDRPAGRLL